MQSVLDYLSNNNYLVQSILSRQFLNERLALVADVSNNIVKIDSHILLESLASENVKKYLMNYDVTMQFVLIVNNESTVNINIINVCM